MNLNSLTWIVFGMTVVAVAVVLYSRLSQSARLRRRLRKTRNPIVSKAPEPSIKFSVKTPKE